MTKGIKDQGNTFDGVNHFWRTPLAHSFHVLPMAAPKMMVGGNVKSHDSSFLRARKKMTLCNIYETQVSGKEVALPWLALLLRILSLRILPTIAKIDGRVPL